VVLAAADVPPLLDFADQAQAPMAARVLLLEELSRRRLADPTDRYVRWLAAASLAELVPLARAAGRHNHPSITEALAARLKDADEETATLAARALGEPFHDSAAPLLAHLAAAPDRRKLASAAVESLGRMGTPAAREALSELLGKVEDPARLRAIQTQLNRLAQQAPSAAPGSSASAGGETGTGGPAAAAGLDTDRPRSWLPSWELAVMAALGAAVLLALLRRRRR
jgi:HEAT repeat protein